MQRTQSLAGAQFVCSRASIFQYVQPFRVQFSDPLTNCLTNIAIPSLIFPHSSICSSSIASESVRAFNINVLFFKLDGDAGGWWYISIEYAEFENQKVDNESYCMRPRCYTSDERRSFTHQDPQTHWHSICHSTC